MNKGKENSTKKSSKKANDEKVQAAEETKEVIDCGSILNTNLYAEDAEDDSKYMKYYAKAEIKIRKALEKVEYPYDCAMVILKATCSFYQASWCGIVTGNPEEKKWAPMWWYSAEKGEMADTRLFDDEYRIWYDSWAKSLETGFPIMLYDFESVKESNPVEYEVYQKLDVKNVLAVPFHRKNTGFIIIRDAQKYEHNIGFLKDMLGRVLALIDEQVIVDSLPEMREYHYDPIMDQPLKKNEMIVSLFGNPQIRCGDVTVTEFNVESLHGWPMLIYLLLNGKNGCSIREIVCAIEPNSVYKNMRINFNSAKTRLNKYFRTKIGADIISRENGVYIINPKFDLMTDVELFEERWLTAQTITKKEERIKALEGVASLFLGHLYQSHSDEAWIYINASNYEIKYDSCIKELFPLLHEYGMYDKLRMYASIAVTVNPENLIYNAWLYTALVKLGLTRTAKDIRDSINNNFDDDEYEKFMQMTKKNLGQK